MFNTPYLAKPNLASLIAAAQALFDRLRSSWHGLTNLWAGVREAIPHVAVSGNQEGHHFGGDRGTRPPANDGGLVPLDAGGGVDRLR